MTLLAVSPARIRTDILNAFAHISLLADIDSGVYPHPITLAQSVSFKRGALSQPVLLDYWSKPASISFITRGFAVNLPGFTFSVTGLGTDSVLAVLCLFSRTWIGATWKLPETFRGSNPRRVGRWFVGRVRA